MSILDGPASPPEHMPTKFKVVLGVYAVSLLITAAGLFAPEADTRTWIRLVIGVAVIVLLLRGSEGMRTVVRFFAAIGVIFGLVVLVQSVSVGLGHTFALIAFATGLFGTVSNAFTFWALGQEDVQVWMATRSFKVPN